MTTISPTRVSMYDFLYQDMQPTVTLLADVAQLSLPQTRLALKSGLQAIVIALLAYEQHQQASAVHKKLLTRGAVKELRQYNAMNFATIAVTLYHRNDVVDAVFGDMATVMKASSYIATQIDASTEKVNTLLTSLSLLVLRELAILVDYSQLDHDELAKWFDLQPQFLLTASVDSYWYELTQFDLDQPVPAKLISDTPQVTASYMKVIGRADEDIQPGQHKDTLVFAPMADIELPNQRWLLQLAKIADICLSRNRLRITSEPATAPVRPLVKLGLISENKDNTLATPNKNPINLNKPLPLWRNPTIFIIILVIGILSALAALKYNKQKSQGVVSAADAVYEHDHPKDSQ